MCITYTVAVQRKYESLRRSWKLGEDESSKEREVNRGQEKKYRARKKGYNADVHVINLDTIIYMPQKFDNRALVVTPAEIQRWKQLNINYMSDEHDDQDPQVVLLHQSQWRLKSESCTHN